MKSILMRRLTITFGVLFTVFSSFATHSAVAKSFEVDGIIGGQGPAPYAALVHSDGSVITIPGLPTTGLTYRVGMNHSKKGLIGGTAGINAYAAFVEPTGLLTPMTGLMAPGEIYTVAINQPGLGIIGGGNFLSNIPYAALVSSNGTVIPLAVPASGLIYGVAIDDSGRGIIGGIGPLNSAYAAITFSNGSVIPLTGLPVNGGIFWTSVNQSGKKFIGGGGNDLVYAAFVSSEGTLNPILGLPAGQAYSVGINASGTGIIGGTSLNLPYAALVAPSGTVTTLAGLPLTSGIIYNTAINDSGTSLIAGFSASGPYGAFVNPQGVLTPLIGLPTGVGFLDGIALHSSGIALVGGTSQNVPFAAFAAPNGTLTYLSGLPAKGEINSTAIAALERLVPKRLGPYDSWANTQFTLGNALSQHFLGSEKARCQCDDTGRCEDGSSLWLAPFGNDVKENARNQFPSFSNRIAGVMVGYDCNRFQDIVLGGALAYVFNQVRFSKKLDKAAINQESVVLYAAGNTPHFYMNVALWGGLSQATYKRHSFLGITSKADFSSWNLCPHFELSAPFCLGQCQKFVIDPFISLDWANHWQNHLREHGRSGFNIVLNDLHASILRSEIGIRLFETVNYEWGSLVIEEKASYVNRTPAHKGKSAAHFIGANSSFDVETVCPAAKNLGVAQIHMECIPSTQRDIYASIDYQGEFGCSYQSHQLTLTFGKNF